MRVTSITAHYTRRISVQPYGSMEYGCSMTAEILEGESPDQAYDLLAEHCRENVKAQMLPFVKQQRALEQDVFEHLPQDAQEKIREVIANAGK